MRRRTRYSDVKNAGSSGLTDFRPGEDPAIRHARRLETNLQYQDDCEVWCSTVGLTLTITNHGQHWCFRDEAGFLCEWWASSAKLVFMRLYKRGVHCHDWIRAAELILEWRASHAAR